MTDFYTDRFVGGLVGSGCHVYDCHSAVALTLSEATIGATDHRTYVGGLAGEAEELYRCQNSGAVTVSATATNYSIGKPRNFVYVGGVAGTADVRESSNRGALQLSCHVINDTSSNGGGFIYGYLGGILGRGTSVQNCYATGSMHIQAVADKSFSSYPNSCADVCVNPIVGIDPRTGFVPNLETVTCCYQMGSVTSATGGNATPKVTIGTTPAVYGADHLAVSSLPASMSIPATYQDFDFDEIWSFDADSAYPKLRWEMESPNAITFESTPAEVYETVEGCSPDLSALMLRLHYADRTVVGRASAAYLLDYDPNTLGEQRVKLRLGDAELEESILIRVVKKTATAIEMQTLPTKTIYERNYDAFDPAGGSIRISYDNGTSEILPLTADMVSGFDNLTAGTCTITVNHSDLSCSFPVEIIYLYALGLDTLPTKLSYVQGQPLDLSGAVLIGVYSNRTSKEIPLSEVQVSYNTGAVGTVSVTLSYRSCSTSFNITVNKKVIASYTFTKPDTQYVLGESLRGGQFLVTYVSEDNYQETIPLTDALLTGFDTTEEGIRKATATYFGCEETFWYNVLPLIASVSYTETTDGLEVTLTLNLDASDAHLILASYENDQMYTSTLGVWNAEESSFELALKHADAGQTFCLYILQSDYTPRTDKTPVVLSASAA